MLSAKDFGNEAVDPNVPQYIALASRVWELMFRPRTDRFQDFTVTTANLAKWLDTQGVNIPYCGTLLIDEGHDISPAWRSLLDRYSGGVVLMGDPYQTSGRRATRRPEHAKALTMHASVRTGEQAMPLIRSVLSLHSESLIDVPLIGSRDRITRPHFYQHATELPDRALHVYGSEWTLLEAALRLKHAGATFAVLDASAKQVTRAVDHALSLKKGDYPRYRVRSLARFHDWAQLVDHWETSGQSRLTRLFARGFTRDDAAALWSSATSIDDSPITLGLLGHCKNLEASVVTMSGCCFITEADATPDQRDDEKVKDVYVAMTRVCDQLWLPPDAMERFFHRSQK
jgi:hypothetical protein